MNYAKAFKIIRSVKQLEQQQLASLLDVHTSYISLIEKNKRTPNETLIGVLAKKLSIPKSLIILLASGKEDLNSLNPNESEKIGKELLKLLLLPRYEQQ